jgi:glycosyltransferase involved in cell wall biosynthesis
MLKIHILHLMNDFSDSSISRIVLRLIDNIGTEDFCWHVGALSNQGGCKDDFFRLGVQIIDFSKGGSNNSYTSIREIRNYISANSVRIVHTHTPHTIFFAALALLGISNITHLSTKHLLNGPADRRWGCFFSLIDRLSLYFPDRLIPVSQRMYQQIIRQIGIETGRVTMIRNAIPCEQFYVPEQRILCRKELGLPLDAIVLGYVGRIQRVKRIDLLLDTFKQITELYSNTYLIVVGEGDIKSNLEAYAAVLGISHKIIWTGFRQDIPRILSAMDIYIQLSLNEGLSLSILEAMMAGKPVVATDVGGNSEIIKNEVNGLLITDVSTNNIVKATLRLINHPELRERMSLAGLKSVNNKFSLKSMVANYHSVYKNILSGY